MNDEPEVFGMNENANIAFQVCSVRYRPMLCKGIQEVFAFSLCTHHLFPHSLRAGQTHADLTYPNPCAKVYVKSPCVSRPLEGAGKNDKCISGSQVSTSGFRISDNGFWIPDSNSYILPNSFTHSER